MHYANHVHALLQSQEGWPLKAIVHSWKSFTAQAANRILGRTGAFWFREYHDRFIRNAEHFTATKQYIEQNPVKAGMVQDAQAWPWSHLGQKAHRPRLI